MSALSIEAPAFTERWASAPGWRALTRRSSISGDLIAPSVSPITASTFQVCETVERRWTREEMLEGIVVRLNRDLARASALPSGTVLMRLLSALGVLVFDDAPTPQLAVDDAGAVEVEWLVNGFSLTLVFEEDGEAQLWASSPDGEELFAGSPERTTGEPDQDLLLRAASYLSALAPKVRERAWEASAT